MKLHQRVLFVLMFASPVCTLQAKLAPNIRQAILAEVAAYPKLEIQDIYKLAYQAAMGNEHIMADTAESRRYLIEELDSVQSSSGEPPYEYLTSDSSVVRVNLRAFKARRGDPAQLVAAMTATAAEFHPSTETLRRFWNDVVALAEEGKIPFAKDALRQFFAEQERQNFPAVHHSKVFEETYHPSYRVAGRHSITMHER